MTFCKVCGKEINEGHNFCVGCGTPISAETVVVEECIPETVSGDGVNMQAAEAPKTAKMSIGMLVWSIINMVFGGGATGGGLCGAVAVVFTLLSNGEAVDKARRFKKISLIFNIIGTAIIALTAIMGFVLLVYEIAVLGESLYDIAPDMDIFF